MAKKREIVKTGGSFVLRDGKSKFVVPRGKDLTTVTREASRQVIDKYRPALEKLREH